MMNFTYFCCAIIATIIFNNADAAIPFQSFEKPNINSGEYPQNQEKVQVDIYYESLCPLSREIYSQQLVPMMRVLGQQVIVKTYPYGNAETDQGYGRMKITCQHGKRECFGNALHACAIDVLGEEQGVFFNGCLMDTSRQGDGSDKLAANVCAGYLKIDVRPIMKCAKSIKGKKLHIHYGELTNNRIDIQYVPYVVINGKENLDYGAHLLRDVCAAFKTKPQQCTSNFAQSDGGQDEEYDEYFY